MKKTMNSFLSGILLLGMALVFTGCPYSAEFGIDANPTSKINTQILGNHESKESSDYSYTISKQDDYLYKFEKKSSSSSSIESYNAYLSNIDGVQFLNVYEVGSSKNSYFFYKLTISSGGDTLTLASVTENITEQFKSSEEMKKFFLKYMYLSFFFEKEEDVYVRK
ncbi:MAG: hypothetical protein WCJ85_02075 [Chitinophagaceae bacterium]